ncbi:hypothetical protein PV416_09335 [Streptomyces ipomoeae]|uniref:hypothetical protein n=1 Tax=Streptomyces ipomoeae TaxID=103232 RepID=UPI0029B20877|nr:hypothetical protein [Streptomyces ipomoeae]MDX2700116.1 hypothetical protein [Streptomyces ipomoeae]MDX2821285.1 hypothetical protein [Streptomyces ipomoeae]MDX2845189.1 hypothetical protein [Streptomyces ipomoeae]
MSTCLDELLADVDDLILDEARAREGIESAGEIGATSLSVTRSSTLCCRSGPMAMSRCSSPALRRWTPRVVSWEISPGPAGGADARRRATAQAARWELREAPPTAELIVGEPAVTCPGGAAERRNGENPWPDRFRSGHGSGRLAVSRRVPSSPRRD